VLTRGIASIRGVPNFRPAWDRIGELRLIPVDVLFVIATATAPPEIITEIHSSLHLRTYHLHINAGSDNPNIELEVRPMNGCTAESMSDLKVALQLLKKEK